MIMDFREILREEVKKLFAEGFLSSAQFAKYNEVLDTISKEELLDRAEEAMKEAKDEAGEFGFGGDWWKAAGENDE